MAQLPNAYADGKDMSRCAGGVRGGKLHRCQITGSHAGQESSGTASCGQVESVIAFPEASAQGQQLAPEPQESGESYFAVAFETAAYPNPMPAVKGTKSAIAYVYYDSQLTCNRDRPAIALIQCSGALLMSGERRLGRSDDEPNGLNHRLRQQTVRCVQYGKTTHPSVRAQLCCRSNHGVRREGRQRRGFLAEEELTAKDERPFRDVPHVCLSVPHRCAIDRVDDEVIPDVGERVRGWRHQQQEGRLGESLDKSPAFPAQVPNQGTSPAE